MAQQEDVFKKLISHCKEYGFVFPSSEIYDGLSAVYDYGQMGVELKNNIKIKAGTHPEKPEMRACFVMLLQLLYCGKTSCDVPNI